MKLVRERQIIVSCVNVSLSGCETSPRRRAYCTTLISDHHPTKRAFTPSDPCSVAPKNPLRRAKVQELVGQSEAQWRRDYQVRTIHISN